MNHYLILSAFWLSGIAVNFIVTRAYWKVNNCWGRPIDTFYAIVLSLIGGSWFGVLVGVLLMGPPWNPNKVI